MRLTTWSRRAVALFVATVVIVAVLLLWPEHVDRWFATWVWNLPLDWLLRAAIYEGAQALANVVLFIPVGLFASWWLPRWWMAIVLGFVVSSGFELVQALLPGRTSDLWDVAWNTLGGAVGAVLGLWYARGRAAAQPTAREE